MIALARQAREQGIEVSVLTGDRDLFQLIEPGVQVIATGRGVTDTGLRPGGGDRPLRDPPGSYPTSWV